MEENILNYVSILVPGSGYTIPASWFDIFESYKGISNNCCKISTFDVQNVQKLVKLGHKVVASVL